ncbi:MAG: DUF1800 domain-containing protein [Campylobacterales bacterium]|nr:DUF1800 domain-containing protein [Campylobacterales bacterium]
MKILLLLFLFFNLLNALSINETKHLLNKTSFSYSQNDLKIYSKFSKEEAIEYLINQAKNLNILDLPKNIKKVSIIDKKYKKLSRIEKKEIRKSQKIKIKELQIWWMKMMLNPSFSFREKMTLFWHNHFVSSYDVVKNPFFMLKQNELYRINSLGNYKNLVHKSSKDLAMLIFLDNNSNKKSSPNENYARELLELFTLGEGNYSEKDVKEAARAFTGWRVNKRKALFKKAKKHHDYDEKIFLKQKGKFDGEDIINIIFQQKQTSIFIISKLYKEFISEDLNMSLIATLTDDFIKSNYDISSLMKNLLSSKDFWDNKTNLIKSPIEFMISLYKNINIDLGEKDYKYFLKTSKALNMQLFNPPGVKGWRGNKYWIDSTSILLRQEFLNRTIRRHLNKKKINELNISSLLEFEEYFYPKLLNIKNEKINRSFEKKKHLKKTYMYLLNNSIYQLK